MKKVLITGVNGFVGQHLVKELLESGLQVVGVGGPRGSTASPGITEYKVLDLMDETATSTINFNEIDSVVHLAGLAAVGPSFDDPLTYVYTNVGLEVHLFEAALKQDKKPRFLIVSSGNLYNPAAPLPLTEESSVIASSPYAVSKLGQEQMAQYYARRGFEIVIARPFNHIGPGQSQGFIVPDFVQQALSIKKGGTNEIMVGNLDAKRDYTDVRDIVRAYRLLLEKGQSSEIYNICSGSSRSGHELLEIILRTVGVQPRIVQDPAKMRPSDTLDIYGTYNKLGKDTGWKPRITLTQTIQDVIKG
jgi:GDP-4-dehydro-6-deoxy-D-mannose reductase